MPSNGVLIHDEDGVLIPARSGTMIMGILNLTPDSFYDGGRFIEPSAAMDRALEMLDEGADWIDIGGESTRPGSDPVTLQEESERIIPTVKALAALGITVSVDTTKADLADRALGEGARIINDISAFSLDPSMASVCARHKALCVLMHMRGVPGTMQSHTGYSDIVREVYAYLEGRLAYALGEGVDRDKIILDPGIGFGKSAEGNIELIRSIEVLKKLGRPVLIGASRKSFIGALTNEPGADRLAGSLSVAAIAAMKGADILRVHDVKETRQALIVAEAIRGPARDSPLRN